MLLPLALLLATAAPPTLAYRFSLPEPVAQLEGELEFGAPLESARRFTVTEGESAARDIGALELLPVGGGPSRRLEPVVDGDGEPSWEVPRGAKRLRWRCRLTGRAAVGGHGEVRLEADRCLVRPWSPEASLKASLSFTALPGQQALLPYPSGPEGTWRADGPGLVDAGYWVLGRFTHTRWELGGIPFDVAQLGPLKASTAALQGWLARSVGEVATFHGGRFPAERVVVALVPAPSEKAAVFGEILRSPHPSVTLFVGDHAPDAAFPADWVAVHELFHLGHPAFFPRRAWITEGLTTYFTDVVQGRSGRERPEEVWGGFADAFENAGVLGTTRSTRELSRTMSAEGHYRLAYWAGAAFALAADVELRRATQGKRSLDDVIRALHAQGAILEEADLAAAIDRIAGRPLFALLERQWLDAPGCPGLPALLASLGVRGKGSKVVLDDAAPLAPIRRAITARP